jgi:predicted nucleic acid-binding protein
MHRLAGITNRVMPARTLDVIKEDPPDNRILECAVEAGSEYVVTWDNDLLRLREYAGIHIVTPSDFPQLRMAR